MEVVGVQLYHYINMLQFNFAISGSVLGTNESEEISIIELSCNGGEDSLEECKYARGVCPSHNYVTVYCNESVIKIKSMYIY